MSNLFRFLTNLATDPQKQALFEQNPELLMEAAGLSAADQAVLKSKDGATIAAAFADELLQPAFWVGDPDPDPLPDPDPPGDE